MGVDNREFVPTPDEWDALVALWDQSKNVFASTLASSPRARMTWAARKFVDDNKNHMLHQVRVWLEANHLTLEPDVRWNNEPTRPGTRLARGTNEINISPRPVAVGPGADRAGRSIGHVDDLRLQDGKGPLR